MVHDRRPRSRERTRALPWNGGAFALLLAASLGCTNPHFAVYNRARDTATIAAYQEALRADLPEAFDDDLRARIALRRGVESGAVPPSLEELLAPVGPFGIRQQETNRNPPIYQGGGGALRSALVAAGPPGVDVAIELARHRDETVKEEAIEALGDSGDPRAVEPLLALLAEKGWWKTPTIAALRRLGDPRAIQALLAYYSELPLSEQLSVTPALYDIALKSRPVDVLLPYLGGPDPPAREVVSLLSCIGDDRAVEPLLRLKKSDPTYDLWVTYHLRGFSDPAVIDALDQVVREPTTDAFMERDARDWGSLRDVRYDAKGIAELRKGPTRDWLKAAAASSLEELATRQNDHDAGRCSRPYDPRAGAVLDRALRRRDLYVVIVAAQYFVTRGLAGSEAVLLEAFEVYGDVGEALVFANSGNGRLVDAGLAWAESRGRPFVRKDGKWAGPKWGRGG
jgi:HEAT repeat protein